MLAATDLLVTTLLTEWVLESILGVDLLEKNTERKSEPAGGWPLGPADYFRQVRGQDVPFTGEPGSGIPVGGS